MRRYVPGQKPISIRNKKPEGQFQTRQFADVRSGETWSAPAGRPTTPLLFETEAETFDASSRYDLISQSAEPVRNGMRLSIVLADLLGRARFTLVFEMYDDQPVLRYTSVSVTRRPAAPM